jgi:hypothetical protein
MWKWIEFTTMGLILTVYVASFCRTVSYGYTGPYGTIDWIGYIHNGRVVMCHDMSDPQAIRHIPTSYGGLTVRKEELPGAWKYLPDSLGVRCGVFLDTLDPTPPEIWIRIWYCVLPQWVSAIVLVLVTYPPCRRLWNDYRIRQRPRNGLCAACGYDLRATPDRCPECGNETGK